MGEAAILTQMVLQDEVREALSGMILSPSGWRGIFAAGGGEESRAGEIDETRRIIAAGAAMIFARYLHGLNTQNQPGGEPLVLAGSDTRPTGKAIADIMIPVLLARGCRVRYAGVVAAPEIMAWAKSLNGAPGSTGFVYISASHNPIGHNGFKFGLTDGGVLPAEETLKLIAGFRSLMAEPDSPARLEKLITGADSAALRETLSAETAAKKEARKAYFSFSAEVAWEQNDRASLKSENIADVFRRGIEERPLGVCCDFNGSARCVSIDRDFFGGLGIQFAAINEEPGRIVHRIVPEGESLDPCRLFLEEQHHRNPAFILGYVPDCDGDRGNLVIWDETLQKARTLEAQEVFALACIAELAHLAWAGNALSKAAVVVNDPTSLRIDRIAKAFGASVFRAETGEANVVGLARRLREKGYTVRILGEGSAGGTITHPSAVRDPLHTVLALAKLLSVRTINSKPGLFELWRGRSGRTELCRPGFGLADVIASLPPFAATSAYSPEALLQVAAADHGKLKDRYQHIFLREWEERKDQLKARYGIHNWEAAAYNGMEERRNIARFGEAGKGGLKICFLDTGGTAVASIWMRGSATEPVFRIMADAEGAKGEPPASSARHIERDLIDWQRRMIMEADNQVKNE